mgnify:CR=1 FL=1
MKNLFIGWIGKYAIVIGLDISFRNDGQDVEYWHWWIFWLLKKLRKIK